MYVSSVHLVVSVPLSPSLCPSIRPSCRRRPSSVRLSVPSSSVLCPPELELELKRFWDQKLLLTIHQHPRRNLDETQHHSNLGSWLIILFFNSHIFHCMSRLCTRPLILIFPNCLYCLIIHMYIYISADLIGSAC